MPSSRKPPWQRRQRHRSRTIDITSSSETSSPRRIASSAAFMAGLASETQRLARNRSPVESWQVPKRLQSSAAWVPLPTPGGPMSTSRYVRPRGEGCGSQRNSLPRNQDARFGKSFIAAASSRIVLASIGHRRRRISADFARKMRLAGPFERAEKNLCRNHQDRPTGPECFHGRAGFFATRYPLVARHWRIWEHIAFSGDDRPATPPIFALPAASPFSTRSKS